MPHAGALLSIAILAAAASPGSALAADEFQGHLTGIVIAASLREAIFIEDGATRRLHPGDTIEGWTLVTVEPNEVTLAADGATTRLSPARTASSGAESTPPPPPERTHQVSNALLRQQRDQAAAEAAMTSATARMEAEKAARNGSSRP